MHAEILTISAECFVATSSDHAWHVTALDWIQIVPNPASPDYNVDRPRTITMDQPILRYTILLSRLSSRLKLLFFYTYIIKDFIIIFNKSDVN